MPMTNVEGQKKVEEVDNENVCSTAAASPASGESEMIQFFRDIELGFQTNKEPEFMLDVMLSALCSYYQAEWVGVVDVDLDMGWMAPYYWYHSGKGSMTETTFSERLFSEGMRRWVEALENNKTVKVINIQEIKNQFPEEYDFYLSQDIRSVIAAPFYRGATGFLGIKNPKKYVNDPGFLQAASQIIAAEAREKKKKDARGGFICPEEIKSESDVIIYLFGRVKISTAYGMIPSSRLKGTIIEKIIRVLTIKDKSMTPQEIAALIDKSDNQDKTAKNIRHNISTFRRDYGKVFGEGKPLIINDKAGYRLNPDLNIITDISMFEMYSSQARKNKDQDSQIRLLKKAVNLFKGDITSHSEPTYDFVGEFYHYRRIYRNVLDELCGLLFLREDFETLHRYATKAFHLGQHEMIFYYWGIKALYHKGSRTDAMKMLHTAREMLDEESYNELIKKIEGDLSPECGVQMT